MTLEQMLATPSVVAALVVVAVVVFVVAFLLGRRQGFQDVQDGVDPNDPSLVRSCEEHVPVRPPRSRAVHGTPAGGRHARSFGGRRLAGHGPIRIPAARRFGIIHDQAMALAEIRDIVKLVSTDSVVRERELTIPCTAARERAW